MGGSCGTDAEIVENNRSKVINRLHLERETIGA